MLLWLFLLLAFFPLPIGLNRTYWKLCCVGHVSIPAQRELLTDWVKSDLLETIGTVRVSHDFENPLTDWVKSDLLETIAIEDFS